MNYDSYYENLKFYLEDLYSSTSLGNCAGKVTDLPLLHKNKVKNEDLQTHSLELLKTVFSAFITELPEIDSIGDFLPREDIKAIHDIVKDVDFLQRNKEQIMATLIRLRPYLESIERLFYFLKKDGLGNEILGKIRKKISESFELFSDSLQPHSNFRFPEYFDFELNFQSELLEHGYVDLMNAYKENFFSNYYPIGIFGNPGYGKTIFLRQLTNEITDYSLQLEPSVFTRVPFFFKAKILAKCIKEICTREVTAFSEDGEQINYRGTIPNSFEELVEVIRLSAVMTEPSLDLQNLNKMIDSWKHNLPHMLIIVDAMDECGSRDERYSIFEFLEASFSEFTFLTPEVIFSCRWSHNMELNDISVASDFQLSLDFEMSFTQEELENIMPTKLANAWGISSDRLSYIASKNYFRIQHAAKSPLFVGFYCWIIYNKMLDRINLGDKPIKLPIKGDYSFESVEFLKMIIDIGLEIIIKDRISNFDAQQVRSDFLLVSSVSKLMNSQNYSEIFHLCEIIFSRPITEQNQRILKENLGIIFVSDGKNFEFTHETIMEVALGLLMIEDEDFLKILKTDLSHILEQKWSTCQLLTLADAPNISSKPTKYNLMNRILSVVDKFPSSIRFLINNVITIDSEIIDKIHYTDGKLTIGKTKSKRTWEYHLLDRFETAANSDSPFSLPQNVFLINTENIKAHQNWRIDRIKQTRRSKRVMPLMTNERKLTLVNLKNIEQIQGIWTKGQITRSIIENWDIYSDLYSNEVIVTSYRKFMRLDQNNDISVSPALIYNTVKRLIQFDNKDLIDIFIAHSTESRYKRYNQAILSNLNMSDVIESYINLRDLQNHKKSITKNIDVCDFFVELENKNYSDETKRWLFQFCLKEGVYSDALRILFQNATDGKWKYEDNTNVLILLKNLGAPEWMIRFELANKNFSRRNRSIDFARELRRSQD